MATLQDFVSVYLGNTEKLTAKLFKGAPGFASAVRLGNAADSFSPLEDIDNLYETISWQGATQVVDADLFGPNATRASVEADIASLDAQIQAGGPAALQVDRDEKQALLNALLGTIAFSADLALFATDYNNAAAVEYLRTPSDPDAKQRLDDAAERALYLFPDINGEPTPVRWRFPERVGSFYVHDGELNKPGSTQIATPLGSDYIRTDLSREAINGQVLALARLYATHPDQAVKDRLGRAIVAVAENLQRHGFDSHVDAFGFTTSFSATGAARRLLPRPLSALIPDSDQLDSLKGGDKLQVYSMLRAAALVDPATWEPIGAQYYRDFEAAFDSTTISLYYRFYTLSKSKTGKYATLLGIGGLAGAIVGGIAGGLLALVGLPFLSIALLGVLAGVGGVVHVLANRKIEVERFSSVYESIQLEQRMVAFLLEFEPAANTQARKLWQDKLAKCFVLQRRKLDALTCAYWVDSPLGTQMLAVDLAALDQQIANIRRQLRKAKKRWCSMLTSGKRRRKYRRLAELFSSLRVYRKLVWLTKTSAHTEIPKRVVLAHYAHTYSRKPADHNQGGSLGTVLDKLSTLTAHFANAGGLELGTPEIGEQTLSALAPPGPLRTTIAFTDRGMDEVQYRFEPEPYLWSSRRSVTKHPVFRFSDGVGETFFQPGGAVMASALLRRNGLNP